MNRDGKSQRREEKKKEDQKEKVSEERRSMQVREKVGKSRNIVLFQWYVAPEGRKVGSLKRIKAAGAKPAGQMRESCTPLWREAHFQVKSVKNCGVRSTFGRSDVVLRGRRKGCAPCQKWAKREGFVAFQKTMAGVGHLKRICKDEFSVAGAVQETCSSELLGGPGADFLRWVALWSMRSSVLGRWFCVTGAALRMTWYHFFVAGAVL